MLPEGEITIGSINNATVKMVHCKMNLLVTISERTIYVFGFLSKCPLPYSDILTIVSVLFLQWKMGSKWRSDSQSGINWLHVMEWYMIYFLFYYQDASKISSLDLRLTVYGFLSCLTLSIALVEIDSRYKNVPTLTALYTLSGKEL